MRRVLLLLVAIAAAHVFAGCGGKYRLPTETPGGEVSLDKSYQLQAVWSQMPRVRDILYVPQGIGGTLYVLFDKGPAGTATPAIRSYRRFDDSPNPTPRAGFDFPGLNNPVAMCVGGDGAGTGDNRIFVLDQGDTCAARANDSGDCQYIPTPTEIARVRRLDLYWRLREYKVDQVADAGGNVVGIVDTVSTFSDTLVAWVQGVAADREGRVYVSCLAIEWVPNVDNTAIVTRSFVWRVFRYLRGPRYPGITPADPRMPGSNWHRDSTWQVAEGAGDGTLRDPRGLFLSQSGISGLFAADYAKDWVQKLSTQTSSQAVMPHVEGAPYLGFAGPEDVAGDVAGYFYVADRGNRRVLRFDPNGAFVQRVDIKPDTLQLVDPVAVAADDSIVYIGDAGRGRITRYWRLP